MEGGIDGAVDGFFIYYAPFDRDDSLYEKHVVHGGSVRHAVLSRLSEATPYSIRMTSFGTAGPDTVGGESDFSNSVVKATLGRCNIFLSLLKYRHGTSQGGICRGGEGDISCSLNFEVWH